MPLHKGPNLLDMAVGPVTTSAFYWVFMFMFMNDSNQWIGLDPNRWYVEWPLYSKGW